MRASIKWIKTLVALGAAAMLLAGCIGGGGGGSSTPAAPTTGSLKFDNTAATVPIDEAYVTPVTSATWGSIRNASQVAGGATWTLSGLAPDTYDARVVSYGMVSTYYSYGNGMAITAGSTYTLNFSDTGYTGSLIVYNNSVSAMTALYVSTTGYGFGTNVLSTSVASGGSRQIVNIPGGFYYVRAVVGGVNVDSTATIASYSYTPVYYY